MAQSFPALAEEGMISGAAAETTANFKSISSGQVIMTSSILGLDTMLTTELSEWVHAAGSFYSDEL